ncbi:hypothetical protein Godav_001217, partial [Gossypium davidsonii]|nr:hypothetical protein [Gossypium davidsonii]
MMTILVQTDLKKVVTGKKPENEYGIAGGILMEKTSSELWKRLETLYATKSLAN